MKLNEFLTENIFTLIDDAGGLDFIPPENLDTMDRLLRFKHGNKPIDRSVENVTMPQLADMVVMLYKQLWTIESGLYELVQEGAGGQVNKIKETTNKDTERITDSSRTDKISAYNSSDMVDDSGNEEISSDDLIESGVREVTTVNNNPKASFNLLETHVKNSIIGQIVNDVGSFLTLKIYR